MHAYEFAVRETGFAAKDIDIIFSHFLFADPAMRGGYTYLFYRTIPLTLKITLYIKKTSIHHTPKEDIHIYFFEQYL